MVMMLAKVWRNRALRLAGRMEVSGRCLLTKIAFIRVESGSKAMHIANRIGRATTTSDRGETDKHWRFLIRPVQEGCVCDI